MRSTVFVKRYTDPARGMAARAHWRWLVRLDSAVRMPRLHLGTATHLVFEYLDGARPLPADLPQLAQVLGRLHITAYRQELHAARLDRPFRTETGLVIGDFCTGRQVVLGDLVDRVAVLPAAIYKDANLRNFIITDTGPAMVDFDDLTLAPYGYDLAKLVVSTAMTHGRIPAETITAALDTYNAATTSVTGPDVGCPLQRFQAFTELHHALTARYLHRNGYRHSWPAVRPWAAPTQLTPPGSTHGHHD